MPAKLLEAWADLYDAVYAARGKRYDQEAETLRAVVDFHGAARSGLLDVACGTGEHLRHLQRHFDDVAGADRCPAMLAVARAKLPGVPFDVADMTSLELGRRFAVVTCLFASIAYVPDAASLTRAVTRMAAHLEPGGLLLVEPGVTPDRLRPPARDRMVLRFENRTVVRETTASVAGGRLEIRFDFTVTENGRVTSFTDEHSIGVFDATVYEAAFRKAGLDVSRIDAGPDELGLYAGRVV